MPHRAILATTIAGVMLLGSSAVAQRRPEVSFGAGVAFPATPGRFNEVYRWAMGGGVGVGIRLSPRLAIQAQADYSRFILDQFGYLGDAGQVLRDLFLAGSLGVSGGQANTLTLLVNARARAPLFGGALSPYATAGIGGLLLWTNAVTLTVRTDPPQPTRREGGTELSPSAMLGFGVEVAQGEHAAWSVESGWVVGFTRSGLVGGTRTSYFPIRVAVTLR